MCLAPSMHTSRMTRPARPDYCEPRESQGAVMWEMRLIREIRLAMSSSQVYENHELFSG